MEKMLMRNAYNARYVIASFTGVLAIYNFLGMNYLTHYEIFGYDGNGGHMLKIITDLWSIKKHAIIPQYSLAAWAHDYDSI